MNIVNFFRDLFTRHIDINDLVERVFPQADRPIAIRLYSRQSNSRTIRAGDFVYIECNSGADSWPHGIEITELYFYVPPDSDGTEWQLAWDALAETAYISMNQHTGHIYYNFITDNHRQFSKQFNKSLKSLTGNNYDIEIGKKTSWLIAESFTDFVKNLNIGL